MPFKLNSESTPEELLSQISESKINLEEGNWKQVSNEAKVRKIKAIQYLGFWNLLPLLKLGILQ